MSNKNIDPLEELLNRQRAAVGKSSDKPAEDSTTGDSDIYDEPVADSEIIDDSYDPYALDHDEDIYGYNDLNDEIENEEITAQEERRIASEEYQKHLEEVHQKEIMPPNEYDMKYHEEAIGYQTDKIDTVTGMVNRVVAKYRLISGGIPDEENIGTYANMGIIGKRAVMGELVDIYHKNGTVITPEFEQLILSNWIMPDGTRAIDNIDENGYVNDSTIVNQPTKNNTTSNSSSSDEAEVVNKPEVPTININVEKNTPVTINVDESIMANTVQTNEVNIYVKEVSEQELLKTTIVENSETPGIISPFDPGINDVPLTLPLSAYRCVMRAINWYDFIKLTAPSSNNSSDSEMKKWSVIYNHLKNPSIGNFDNFEDFMKKTKYQDRELLMWGILVATADEEENLSITCGNKNCRNPIKITYNPRNIAHVDDEHVSEWYLKAHEAAVGEDAVSIWENATNRRKRYKLPSTGIIAEINEPSAYEFVTEKLPLIDKLYKRFRPEGDTSEIDPNDPSMLEFDYLSANALYISAMTIVSKDPKTGEDKEYRFTNWDQIESIITTALNADDSGILLKIIEKTRSHVSPISFRLNDIRCPKCGRLEEYIPITDIGSTLLFQVSRRFSNTQINLIEMD